MDSKQIEILVEKYWNCETTLDEEKQLRAYFQGNVPSSLNETAQLFRYFETQHNQSVGADFDSQVKQKLTRKHAGKSVRMFVNYARIAAGIAVVIAAGYFIHLELQKTNPTPEDTYTDPRVALEETKKALLLISNSFNKAHQQAGKIKMFNEAEQKIQGKTNEARGNEIQL
jgi:hypothetical protein